MFHQEILYQVQRMSKCMVTAKELSTICLFTASFSLWGSSVKYSLVTCDLEEHTHDGPVLHCRIKHSIWAQYCFHIVCAFYGFPVILKVPIHFNLSNFHGILRCQSFKVFRCMPVSIRFKSISKFEAKRSLSCECQGWLNSITLSTERSNISVTVHAYMVKVSRDWIHSFTKDMAHYEYIKNDWIFLDRPCTYSVSYTHLDVYKRQYHSRGFTFRKLLGLFSYIMSLKAIKIIIY